MRKTYSLLAAVAIVGTMGTGCANTEQKFGRGLNNMYEIVRGGEWRRTTEQMSLFYGPESGHSVAVVRGFNRSLARTGIGIYEVITAPFPPYGPVCTSYLAPDPVYPDNYAPRLMEDSLFATDTNLGYSGGDVAPWFPGSRFRIFDSH